ncbi:MAG: class I SAM-dependent methyltransferase [Acidimicrobiales bacterium]
MSDTSPDSVARPGTAAERGRLRTRGRAMFANAMDYNMAQIAAAARQRSFDGAVVCDIGCWDGETFLQYAPPGAALIGLERNEAAVAVACKNGISAIPANIEETWPLEDQSVDVITSNQVIEHVTDTDHFVKETFRVLRSGGTACISTENLASWHNIGACFFGWQPFSITNVSTSQASIGNPLSNLRHAENLAIGWQHVRVFAYRGLIELFQVHGFVDVHIKGAGYYPLPAKVGAWDPRHAAFITVIALRP